MSVTVQSGPAIAIGYQWSLQIEADAALFPTGSQFTAHVRQTVSGALLATLTTGGGQLQRISDTVLQITIPSTDTVGFAEGSVFLDVVRTDVNPDQHMGFILEVQTKQPVTRGLA